MWQYVQCIRLSYACGWPAIVMYSGVPRAKLTEKGVAPTGIYMWWEVCAVWLSWMIVGSFFSSVYLRQAGYSCLCAVKCCTLGILCEFVIELYWPIGLFIIFKIKIVICIFNVYAWFWLICPLGGLFLLLYFHFWLGVLSTYTVSVGTLNCTEQAWELQ